MQQTRRNSLKESVISVAIGFGIALVAQILILPHYGATLPFKSNFEITLLFTIISIIRQYFVRRWFTGRR
jgi:hypothetical protein